MWLDDSKLTIDNTYCQVLWRKYYNQKRDIIIDFVCKIMDESYEYNELEIYIENALDGLKNLQNVYSTDKCSEKLDKYLKKLNF